MVEAKILEIEIEIDAIREKGIQSPTRMRTILSHTNRRLVRLFTVGGCTVEERGTVKDLMRSLKTSVNVFRSLGSSAPYASSVMSVSARLN